MVGGEVCLARGTEHCCPLLLMKPGWKITVLLDLTWTARAVSLGFGSSWRHFHLWDALFIGSEAIFSSAHILAQGSLSKGKGQNSRKDREIRGLAKDEA